ncbi:MAG TPA: type I-E CRISPR-associated protein Cas6/Cse3/CasE [Rugosimonospora sp.]|nr:type I-E CRISPR-associated protein Cas6/Cse3/CasE [Rugosimonospora sp.]
MYLSRLQVNPARRHARALLRSPHRMHGAVLAGFARPMDSTTDRQRILWRLDQHNHQTMLYIVSPDRPDLTHLVEQAGWPATETWLTRPYRPLLDRLATDQQWAFRLTANPVRNGRLRENQPTTRRLGHVTVTQQTKWLLDRAKQHGFDVVTGPQCLPNLLVHDRTTTSFDRANTQPPVTLRTATYDGVLEVTDPVALRHALTAGIGHAKAYGCGLMTLAPLATAT